jgi:hypothetical protein
VVFMNVFYTYMTDQTATALGKLGHPDGELNLTRAAGKNGIIQMVGVIVLVTSFVTHVNLTMGLGVVAVAKFRFQR